MKTDAKRNTRSERLSVTAGEPAVAWIEVRPSATAVMRPAASTVATAVLVEDQVKVVPGMALPLESAAAALNWRGRPVV